MALSTISDALTQFNANPPSTWGTPAAAAACLDAIYFLLANRAQGMGDAGSNLSYASLEGMRTTLETRLGAKAPRANGRSRRVGAAFDNDNGGIQ